MYWHDECGTYYVEAGDMEPWEALRELGRSINDVLYTTSKHVMTLRLEQEETITAYELADPPPVWDSMILLEPDPDEDISRTVEVYHVTAYEMMLEDYEERKNNPNILNLREVLSN